MPSSRTRGVRRSLPHAARNEEERRGEAEHGAVAPEFDTLSRKGQAPAISGQDLQLSEWPGQVIWMRACGVGDASRRQEKRGGGE